MRRHLYILWLILVMLLLSFAATALAEANRSIAIDTGEAVLYAGQKSKFSATVESLTEEAPAKTTIVWACSDKAIAKVDSTGTVMAIAPGTATITCYAKDDETIFAQGQIEVRAAVKALKLSDKNISLLIGAGEGKAQTALACTITPENAYDQTVTWSSSDEAVAIVDENGNVSGVGIGEAIISATSNDPAFTKPVSCVVTVSRAVNEIILDHQDETLYTGSVVKLAASVSPEDAGKKNVIWSSSDPTVANADGNGKVTAKNAGKATITCTATDGTEVSASCAIHVIYAVKSVTISQKTATLVLGTDESAAQLSLTCTVVPESAFYQTITWSSSDEAVATVSQDGFVQAVSAGKAIITAATDDPAVKAASTCTITVGQAVNGISISEHAVTLDKGKKVKLKASVSPENALNTDVTWSSSDEKILTVDSKGTVSAKNVGNATVTCIAADGSGIIDICKVTVVQKVTKISSGMKRVVIFQDRSSKASVRVSPSDATNKQIQWSSSRPYVASIDSKGTITGNRAGEAVITAAATDESGKSCSFKVVVEPANPISLESIGFGIYISDLLGLTVENECKTKTITDFDFEMELYSYSGTLINSGSFSLGKPVKVGPQGTKTIKRTVFGVGYSVKVVITITAVTFSDGSYQIVPVDLRETWTFRR
ncbi:MAG: Ig-like domain-containing protein [Candidatus Limiplasma sp.]|nr:Ig-like domain-containing protein [Candidatus Limiplasma sp.]